MTQDQEVYRKIGRGGAGNFFTPKKTEEASDDLEAQKPDPNVAGAPQPSSTPTGLARSGRGGAGNFVDRAKAEKSEDQDWIAAVATAGLKHQPRVGRGGAGNWLGEEADAARKEDEDRRKAEMERLATEEVDRGLRMPDKVHHGEEKTKQR